MKTQLLALLLVAATAETWAGSGSACRAVFLTKQGCQGRATLTVIPRLPAVPIQSETLFIRAGRLVDGQSNSALGPREIIVRDGRIQIIGRGLQIPDGARIVDLRGYTVLPGLIDMHTHLTARPDDSADLKTHMLTPRPAILDRARESARILLDSGFTTIRDVGTYHSWTTTQIRDEIRKGETPGPRVWVAPFYLTIPGGGGDLVIPGYNGVVPESVRVGVARGAREFEQKTEIAVKGDADLVKIIASGAILAFGSTPGEAEMSRSEIAAVVRTAHRAGLKVAAHAHGAEAIKDAILSGVDTIEHASLVDDEGIRMAKDRGVAFAMDIYNGDFLASEGRRLNWPREFLEKNDAVTEMQRKSFRRAYLAGVEMIFGTDIGVFPYGTNAKQFETMVNWGMSPMDAIKAATSNAAKHLGWSNQVGTIEAGRLADIIAVRGDPTSDIRELENVAVVIKNGNIVRGPK